MSSSMGSTSSSSSGSLDAYQSVLSLLVLYNDMVERKSSEVMVRFKRVYERLVGDVAGEWQGGYREKEGGENCMHA